MTQAIAFDPRQNPRAGHGGARNAHVIVLGNEKGGSGKSTVAMHVIVGLLREGYSVGSIDLDGRQGTLSRYFERRQARAEAMRAEKAVEPDIPTLLSRHTDEPPPLPLPEHVTLKPTDAAGRDAAMAADREALEEAVNRLASRHQIIVIDTPGADTYLNRLGHSYADTLITPMNDSFIDLDLLATVDPESHEVLRPSIYSEMVWETRKRRAIRDRGSIDWIVMRNRLSHVDARNKREIADIMDRLAKRIGFRMAPGFGERVIFRELYLKALTLLDLVEAGEAVSMSHLAARQEVRALLDEIRVPDTTAALAAG